MTAASSLLVEGQRGRMTALAITAVALIAVWFVIGAPLMDAYAEWADANAVRATYARAMLQATRQLPDLRTAAAAAQKGPDTTKALLTGGTDAVAGAALDGAIGTLATAAGAHVTSSEVLPGEAAGAYRRIALRVEVGATWPVLIQLLQQIDRASPRVFVDEIQVHGQPTSEKDRVLPINTTLTLVGFRAPAPQQGPQAGAKPAEATP